MSATVLRDGKLSEISACEVLAALCKEEATGVLIFKGGGVEKSVYLQKGRIVFASSRDPDDRLGELLLTRGVITREQMDQASKGVRAGKRLGTVLVEMGFLPAGDLPRWVREQVKEIVFSLFSWGEGSFHFQQGPLPTGELITLRISNAEIFLSGLRRVQKWSVLRKGAGEIQIPYQLAPNFRQILKEVHLEKDEEALLLLLESGNNTMEEAARNSTLTTLLVYQLFYAFRVLGILVPEEGESSKPQEPAQARRVSGSPTVEKPVVAEGKAPPQATPGPPLRPPVPEKTPAPSQRGGSPEASKPESVPMTPAGEIPAPAPLPDPGAGARTVLLKKPPALTSPVPRAAQDAPPSPPGRRKREYKVVRMEGDMLDGNGGPQIEDFLGAWSKKGYSLAGVVPGKGSSLFNSAPPSYFIFVRD